MPLSHKVTNIAHTVIYVLTTHVGPSGYMYNFLLNGRQSVIGVHVHVHWLVVSINFVSSCQPLWLCNAASSLKCVDLLAITHSNQRFNRQTASYQRGVGDHRVVQWWEGVMQLIHSNWSLATITVTYLRLFPTHVFFVVISLPHFRRYMLV